jgi:hypothetical protein
MGTSLLLIIAIGIGILVTPFLIAAIAFFMIIFQSMQEFREACSCGNKHWESFKKFHYSNIASVDDFPSVSYWRRCKVCEKEKPIIHKF